VPAVSEIYRNLRKSGGRFSERELGVAPPGYHARRVAEALTWQAERLHFFAWTEFPGAMSKQQLCEVSLEAFMRMIFLADDPDPEAMS
jgi:hypothetical protein